MRRSAVVVGREVPRHASESRLVVGCVPPRSRSRLRGCVAVERHAFAPRRIEDVGTASASERCGVLQALAKFDLRQVEGWRRSPVA
jgi:hypothetical protein